MVSRALSTQLAPSSTSFGSMLVAHHHGQQQRRSMVMVTKTNSADPPQLKQPSEINQPASTDTNSISLDTSAEELLTVTPSCVQQVHALLKRRNKSPDEMFLRVFVDAGGCSGYTYKFELDDEFLEDEDLVFGPADANGARVVVDEASLELIQGSKIDYVQEMIKSAFVVSDNPQSESACG